MGAKCPKSLVVYKWLGLAVLELIYSSIMLLISFHIELHSFIFHILNLIIVSWLGLVSWMVGWLLVPLFLVQGDKGGRIEGGS